MGVKRIWQIFANFSVILRPERIIVKCVCLVSCSVLLTCIVRSGCFQSNYHPGSQGGIVFSSVRVVRLDVFVCLSIKKT